MQAKILSVSQASARKAVVCQAQRSQPQRHHWAQLLSATASCGLAASLLLGSVDSAQAADRTIAEVLRPTFEFVDANKDGKITKDEIRNMSKAIAEEEDFDAPKDELVNFSYRVFDLNQDGQLSTEEMLRGLALDRAVGEDSIDGDVVKVMDRDGNGVVDLSEWKAGLGDLGQNGEAVKEFVFNRTDYLTDRDRTLDVQELANALTEMRILVLGY